MECNKLVIGVKSAEYMNCMMVLWYNKASEFNACLIVLLTVNWVKCMILWNYGYIDWYYSIGLLDLSSIRLIECYIKKYDHHYCCYCY